MAITINSHDIALILQILKMIKSDVDLDGDDGDLAVHLGDGSKTVPSAVADVAMTSEYANCETKQFLAVKRLISSRNIKKADIGYNSKQHAMSSDGDYPPFNHTQLMLMNKMKVKGIAIKMGLWKESNDDLDVDAFRGLVLHSGRNAPYKFLKTMREHGLKSSPIYLWELRIILISSPFVIALYSMIYQVDMTVINNAVDLLNAIYHSPLNKYDYRGCDGYPFHETPHSKLVEFVSKYYRDNLDDHLKANKNAIIAELDPTFNGDDRKNLDRWRDSDVISRSLLDRWLLKYWNHPLAVQPLLDINKMETHCVTRAEQESFEQFISSRFNLYVVEFNLHHFLMYKSSRFYRMAADQIPSDIDEADLDDVHPVNRNDVQMLIQSVETLAKSAADGGGGSNGLSSTLSNLNSTMTDLTSIAMGDYENTTLDQDTKDRLRAREEQRKLTAAQLRATQLNHITITFDESSTCTLDMIKECDWNINNASAHQTPESVYQHLINDGLQDIARKRFDRDKHRVTEPISDYDSLKRWLISNIDITTALKKARLGLYDFRAANGWQETYQSFLTAFHRYNATLLMAEQYAANKIPCEFLPITPEAAYVRFLNKIGWRPADRLKTALLTISRPTITGIGTIIENLNRIFPKELQSKRKINPMQDTEESELVTPKQDRSDFETDEDRRPEPIDNNKWLKKKSRKKRRFDRKSKSGKQSGRKRSWKESVATDTRFGSITCFACGEQGHIAPECNAPRNKSRRRNDWNKQTKHRESFYFDKQEIDGWNAEDEFDNLVEFDQHTEHSHDQRHQRDNDRQSVHSKYLETASSTKPFLDTLFRHRFILPFGIDLLPLGTINTTNTNSNLDDAIHCPLEIENFECKSSNGLYSGFIDTGSNTPAMNKNYCLKEGFPLYHLHRSFFANTANGEVEISEATVVRLSCSNPEGSRYWLQQIFYLLDSLPVNILIGRRLMRLLGYDCRSLTQSKFEHTATTSAVLDDEADDYWQKLWDVTDLNEDTVINVEPIGSNHTIGSTYDAPGSTAGDQASKAGDHRTAEGNALDRATKRSLFERSMATTADSTASENNTASKPSHDGSDIQSDKVRMDTTTLPREPGRPKTVKKVRWADLDYSAEDGHTFDGDNHTFDGEESYDLSESNPFDSALKNVRTDEFDEKQRDQTPSKSVVSIIEHNHRIILNCQAPLTSYDTFCGFKELFVSGPNSDILPSICTVSDCI